MPSLLRFLTVIGVLGGLTYGAMFMLSTWFAPQPREITVSVPPDRFAKRQTDDRRSDRQFRVSVQT